MHRRPWVYRSRIDADCQGRAAGPGLENLKLDYRIRTVYSDNNEKETVGTKAAAHVGHGPMICLRTR